MTTDAEELDKALDELHCAEDELEAWTCEFPLALTDEKFSQGFECLGEYIRAVREAVNVVHSEVYAFEWCGCVYESGFSVVSLHKTKAGAWKALRIELAQRWQQNRDRERHYGGRKGVKYLAHEAWRVQKQDVLP